MNNMNWETDNSLHDRLFQILLEEISACDYLEETLAEKQEAIIQNDLNKMNTLTGTEQLIINKANVLIKTRQEIIAEIYAGHGITNGVFTLSDFIGHLDENERSSWNRLQTRLENTVTRINRRNAENVALLNAALSYNRDLLKLFYPRDENAGGVYDHKGVNNKQGYSKNIVDCNV